MIEHRNEDGEYHQINAPAVIHVLGDSWWYNGQRHRYYGPAWQWAATEYWIFHEMIT